MGRAVLGWRGFTLPVPPSRAPPALFPTEARVTTSSLARRGQREGVDDEETSDDVDACSLAATFGSSQLSECEAPSLFSISVGVDHALDSPSIRPLLPTLGKLGEEQAPNSCVTSAVVRNYHQGEPKVTEDSSHEVSEGGISRRVLDRDVQGGDGGRGGE